MPTCSRVKPCITRTASAHRAVTAAKSFSRMASAGSIHVPPQAMTLGRRKKIVQVCGVYTAGGHEAHLFERPVQALQHGDAARGRRRKKNFITSMPYSRTFCTSEAVLTPGRTGTLCSRHQRTTGSLMPGVTI